MRDIRLSVSPPHRDLPSPHPTVSPPSPRPLPAPTAPLLPALRLPSTSSRILTFHSLPSLVAFEGKSCLRPLLAGVFSPFPPSVELCPPSARSLVAPYAPSLSELLSPHAVTPSTHSLTLYSSRSLLPFVTSSLLLPSPVVHARHTRCPPPPCHRDHRCRHHTFFSCPFSLRLESAMEARSLTTG